MKSILKNIITKDRLKKLRKRIVSNEDKILFDEVKSCLLTGAYRSAYIVNWICIAESLKRKFKEMAVRDSEIGKLVGKIIRREEAEKPTDKILMKSALEYGLINKDQYLKLDNIRTMRGLYAHPTGASPKFEEVLSTIVIAVDTILCQYALLRHGYVKGLVTRLFEERHFLDDLREKIEAFAKGVVNRVHKSVYPYLLELIVENLDPLIDDADLNLFRERGIIFTTTFFEEAKVDMKGENWGISELVLKHPNTATLLFSEPSLWIHLSDRVKDIIIGNLLEPKREETITNPTVENIVRICTLRDKGLLSTRHLERFNIAMKKIPCLDLAKAGIPLSEYITEAIDDLSSHNWYRQNPAIEAIKLAGSNQCKSLSKETQEELGRNILQAAEGDAGKVVEFVIDLSLKKHNWSEDFIKGIVLETMVNENYQLRFKKKCLKKALFSMLTLPIKSTINIINEVVNNIHASTLKYPTIKKEEFEQVISIISNVNSEVDIKNIKKALNKLKFVIEKMSKKLEKKVQTDAESIPF